jgi:hypothetical protein
MQAIWMVTMTLVLALSGVLGLALVTHVTSRTRRPVRQRASLRSSGRSAPPATFPPSSVTVPLGSSRATAQGSGEGQR